MGLVWKLLQTATPVRSVSRWPWNTVHQWEWPPGIFQTISGFKCGLEEAGISVAWNSQLTCFAGQICRRLPEVLIRRCELGLICSRGICRSFLQFVRYLCCLSSTLWCFPGVRYTVSQNVNVALDINRNTRSNSVWLYPERSGNPSSNHFRGSSTGSSGVFISELFPSESVFKSSLSASFFADNDVCCIVARISRQFTAASLASEESPGGFG